jgi:hypothetical protein
MSVLSRPAMTIHLEPALVNKVASGLQHYTRIAGSVHGLISHGMDDPDRPCWFSHHLYKHEKRMTELTTFYQGDSC